jgi:hypothetical protein
MSFFALSQSGVTPNKIHTAYNTITTAGGGLANPLISVMSFLFSLLRASSASLSAGMAFANYAWASSVIALISVC